eukprot:2404913-Pyramimonas_sp.AAC.1
MDALRVKGHDATASKCSPCLGVDFTAGEGTRRPTRATRTKKAVKSHLRVRGFVRASEQYRACSRIEMASHQAATGYWHQILGALVSWRRKARQRLGAVSAAAGKGKCLATFLQLLHGAQDLARRLPRQQLELWFRAWRRDADCRR